MFTATSPPVVSNPAATGSASGPHHTHHPHQHGSAMHHHPHQHGSAMHHLNVAALIASSHHLASAHPHHHTTLPAEVAALGSTPAALANSAWHQYSAALDPYAMKQAQQQQYDYHLLMSTFAAPPPPPPPPTSSSTGGTSASNSITSSTTNTQASHTSNGQSYSNSSHSGHNHNHSQYNHNPEQSQSQGTAIGSRMRDPIAFEANGHIVGGGKDCQTGSANDTLGSCSNNVPILTTPSASNPNGSLASSSNSSLSSSLSSMSPSGPPTLVSCTGTSPSSSLSPSHYSVSNASGGGTKVGNSVTSTVTGVNLNASSSASSSSSSTNYYQPLKDTTFTKIFVGGLPYHTTDKSLRAFFEAFGDIEEAVVITDRQTGKSRGYGFVTMVDRESAERAVKDANPIIDGRKANVNLAYLGAKPRNGFLQNGFPFTTLARSAVAAAAATAGSAGAAAAYPTFANSATANAFGPGSQFGFPAQPHIMYHPATVAAAAASAANSGPGTFMSSATPTGLLLTPPGTFYPDYGLGSTTPSAATNPFASGYPDGTILTTFLAPPFGPSSMVPSSTPGPQHYSNCSHNSQQAMVAAAAALAGMAGPNGSATVPSTVASAVTPTNQTAVSAAAATAAAFYLNGSTLPVSQLIDLSDHGTSGTENAANSQTLSGVNTRRATRTPSFSGESARRGEQSTGSINAPRRSQSLRSLEEVSGGTSSEMSSPSASQSVSYTLKPKRVKFCDESSTIEEEDGCKAESEHASAPVNVEFTVHVKKPRGSLVENSKNYEDYQSRIKELSQELSKAKEKIDILQTKNKELENMRTTFGKVESKEGIKHNFDENIKLKQKIDDLEQTVRTLKSDKRSLEERLKQGSTLASTNRGAETEEVIELRTKLAESQKVIAQLTQENDEIKKDVKELEVEFQELHDNFREDQSSEFRVIKRELEAMSKNCRVMQFKLKKSERTIEQLENEKIDLQKQVSDLYETSRMDVDKRRMKELENELSIAKEVSLKLHAEMNALRDEHTITLEQLQESQRKQTEKPNARAPSLGTGLGKLSPTPSLDQSSKDYEQVVRDLYDTMEREKDIQEQLKFSEEETRTMRKKLSTMEQENEILMMQIRKMATKSNSGKEEEDESEELNPEEMKLHLELYEQEMIVLRRKTDELEQENENFQQEIKYLQEKLVSQPLTKVEIPEIPASSPPNVIYDHKIRILETEARELRKKLVDKEKENESLRTEVELHRRRASKVINRSRSLDSEGQSLDMKKQLQLFEQEANILRQKMVMMENDNEKLTNENKRLQLRISKKPPPGPVDQLQIENMELKDKVRELERRCDSLKTDLMNAKLNETTETETDFIANLKKQLRTKETDLSNQASKMAKMDIEYTRINREYKKLKESLVPRRKVNRVIRETATRLELKEIIKEMEEEVEHLQITNRGKDAILENLTEEVSELKRECQELEQKQSTAKNSAVPGELLDLKKKLEEEQHRCKSLQEKLEKLSKTKKVDLDSFDTIEVLKAEKKELAIQVEDLMLDLQKSKSRAEDMEGKLKVFTRNKDDLNSNNVQLRESLDKSEEVIEELSKKLKTSETKEKEVRKKYEEAKQEMERVSNVNQQLKREVDENRNKLAAINSRSGDVSEKSALQQRECEDLKRKLNESNKRIASLQAQLERQQSEFRDKEDKMRDELNEQLEANSKKVRREVHLELQSLREESTNYKNRCNEVLVKLEKTEKELKEANDKIKTHNAQVRRDREELQERIDSLENQLKSEQRKRDKLEREIENTTRGKEEDLLQAQEKIVQLERDIRRHQARLEDQEYDYNGRLNASDRELNKIKQDYEDLTSKYEMLEKDFVDLKSRAVAEKDTLVEAVSSLKKSYEEKLSEIKTLKESSMSQRKEWYQQKLSYQERVADLESKLNKANLVEEERNRLKILVSEKENLLNSYRKEEKMHNEERERNRIKTEELQNRLTELECIERNTRFLSITGRAQVDKELQNYRIRLEHSETSHKGELAALHAEYEGRMRLLGEEVEHMQQQMAMLAQERDRYRESLDKAAKDMNARGSLRGTLRDEIEDLNSQLRTLRSDLEGALLENRNLKIQHGTERTTWQIQLAECKTQINQMEERILLETRGSTRNYARTKMELAWEKERQENHRLLQETQKFIQELRDKLLGTEGLREKERDEARKQLLELKNGMDREHVETQQKISELQFDLLALKEAHARLKSQNERLRRERAAFEKARIDFVNEEMVELQKIVEGAPKAVVGTAKSASVVEAIGQLQNRLKSRLNELMQEAAARGVSSSDLSIVSKLNGRLTGSNTSLSSTNLPPPSAIKRAPPRAMKLAKKSLSLDQQLSNSAMRGASQERIWESDRESLQSTPNSSVTNLRLAPRYGYAGYESDSSGSSFFLPSGALRLRTGFTKEGSFAGGSESDTSCASGQQAKKSLKEKLKIRKTSKTETVSEDEAGRALKQKLALQGFELSPIELAKQREKKEKSLRYKISKTLSKTFSRSTSVLPEATGDSSSNQAKTSSKTRSKSPSRTKSPTRFTQEFKQKSESISTSQARPTLGQTKVVSQVPGIDQLRQRPRQSNLAIPPSRRSPPKTRPRTETNV